MYRAAPQPEPRPVFQQRKRPETTAFDAPDANVAGQWVLAHRCTFWTDYQASWADRQASWADRQASWADR